MKLCFDLYEYNDNKYVCMQDLDKFNQEFTGVCVEVAQDYADISRVLCKKKHVNERSDLPNFDY